MHNADKDVEILLIEDDTEEALLVIRTLAESNLANHLLHIDDGEEALDFIFTKGKYAGRLHTRRPQLILLDLKLPKIDGFEILRQIKGEQRTKFIPVVVLSSSSVERDIIKCYELGVNSYVTKPASYHSFNKTLTTLVLYWTVLNENPGRSGGMGKSENWENSKSI